MTRSVLLSARAIFAVLLSMHLNCTGNNRQHEKEPILSAGGTLVLKSGSIVEVADVRHRRRSDSRETFIVEYLTDLTIDEHEQLQKEVEAIWDVLPERADLSETDSVYLVAQNRATGESVQFVVERDEDGSWQKKGGFAYPSSQLDSGTDQTDQTDQTDRVDRVDVPLMLI